MWAWPGRGGRDPCRGGCHPWGWRAQSQDPPLPLSLLQGCQGPSQRPAWCAVARCRPLVPASAAAPSAPPSCRTPPSCPLAMSRAAACGPRDAEHQGRSDAPGPRGLRNVARSFENLHVDAGPCIQSYFTEPVHPHIGISYGAWAPGPPTARAPSPPAPRAPRPATPRAMSPRLPLSPHPCPGGGGLCPGRPSRGTLLTAGRPVPRGPFVHSLIQQKSGCAAPGSLHPSVSFQPGAERGSEGAPALGQTPQGPPQVAFRAPGPSVDHAGCGDWRQVSL